jgi:hypothetical protein
VPPYIITLLNNITTLRKNLSDFVIHLKNIRNIFGNI